MKKKLSIVVMLALIIVLCFSLTACSSTEFNKELLKNSNFEEEKVTTNWVKDIKDTGKVEYSSQKEDSKYLLIKNKQSLTSNLSQKINVEKGATYKATVKFRINNPVVSSTGFSISFLEDKQLSTTYRYESKGWESYTIYFRPNINSVSVSLRLSGRGTVMIDDVSVMKINPTEVPEYATVYKVNKTSTLPYGKTAEGIVFAVMMTLLTAGIMACGYYALRRSASSDVFLPAGNDQKVAFTKKISLSPIAIVSILLAVGFIVRFILAATVYGYDKMYDDVATIIANTGIISYYKLNPSVIPPGYIYYLGLYGLIKKSAMLNGTMGISIMLKLPSILADIGIIYLIFSFGRKYVGDRIAAIISMLYAILPPVFMLNAGWGGIESLAVLGFVAITVCMIEKKNVGLFFSTLYSLMFSMETVYILPIVISYLVIQCIKDKKFILKSIISSLVLLVVFFLITMPMSYGYFTDGHPFIVIERYYETLGANAIACINNFSIYAIIGLNNVAATKASFALSIVFVILLWAFAIYCYVRKRNRLNLLLIGGFTMLAISTFAVNQNKVPAVVGAFMLLMYAMLSRDKRVYALSAGFFTLNAMNIYTLFDIAGYLTEHPYRYEMFAKFDWLQVLGSVLMVILTIITMFVMYDICIAERRKEIQPIYDNEVLEFKKKTLSNLKIKKAKNE